MSAAASSAARSGERSEQEARAKARARTASSARAPTPVELAWIAVVPTALLVLGLVLALGRPLGELLAPAHAPAFEPIYLRIVHPEPTEHARYLLALLGPLLASGLVVGGSARRLAAWPAGVVGVLVRASQALTVAFVLLALVAQRGIVYAYPYSEVPLRRAYFTVPTLAFAVALAAAALALIGRRTALARIVPWTRESSRRRLLATALALLATAIWLLTAFNTDGSIGAAHPAISGNIAIWSDETFAVLNGRAPLVDFHSQYSELWPYLTAGVMTLLGSSLGVYALTMIAGAAAAMLAIFDLLRRLTRSSLLALGLFLPFLATSFFTEHGPPGNRYGPGNAFSMFPMRYGGPYLLAWLTARQVGGDGRRAGRLALFAAATLVVLNNPEFGVPAFGATLAALLWSGGARRSRVGVLALDAALGLLVGLAAVSLLTLAVAGSLPHLGLLLEFPRLYGLHSFGMLPMPALGLHLAAFATFAAALVLATVRAVMREQDRLFTAMLAWAGAFGLGAGSYFAGRSHPDVLIDLFSSWALALVLLVIAVVRSASERERRLPTLAEAAVLAGFGIAVCSLAQVPAPWTQLRRVGHTSSSPLFQHTAAERFVASRTSRGEHVVIVTPLGHRVAEDLGLVDVFPYASVESIPLEAQLRDVIATLRASGGHTLFLPYDQTLAERGDQLEAAGYRLVGIDRRSFTAEFTNRR